jgi:ParB family chromosome partitioning protein
MPVKKRRLGRGLDALLAGAATENVPVSEDSTAVAMNGAVSAESTEATPLVRASDVLQQLPLDIIQRGKYQPRRDLQPGALEELAASIRNQGVLQPIVVRPIADDRFEIIAGERRWRATQLAGLDKIPALIRDVPDEAAIAMALIENIQREDLNALEEAMALARLRDEFSLTQQEVADAVGKSRASVANLLRLLTLREDVKILLEHGDLEPGHAKAILGLPAQEQSAAASQVVARGLSVRQTEALVRALLANEDKPAPVRTESADPDIKRLQTDLGEKVGVPVKVQHNAKGKGKLIFSYSSLDELDGILDHIK